MELKQPTKKDKYYCPDCDKHFINPEESHDAQIDQPECPYCGSRDYYK